MRTLKRVNMFTGVSLHVKNFGTQKMRVRSFHQRTFTRTVIKYLKLNLFFFKKRGKNGEIIYKAIYIYIYIFLRNADFC